MVRHIVNLDSIRDPDLTNGSIPYITSPKHDSTATLLSINHPNFIKAIRAIKSSMCLVCLHNLAKVSLYVLYCLVFELLLLFLINLELNPPFLSFLNKFRILYLARLETTCFNFLKSQKLTLAKKASEVALASQMYSHLKNF